VGTTALLSNGKVLLAGGYDFAEVLVNAPGPVELYDPVSETWTVMPYLFVFRDSPTATLLPNDKVLFAGGINENFQAPIFHRSAELFDPGLPRPTSLSISPLVVSQGECFTIAVGNGEGMTLDVQYRLDDSPIKTLTQWPKLDERGMAENICTSAQTPTGKYEFTGIRNTDTTPWLPVSSSLVVTPP
jgi:hypothetical protein